MTGRDFRAERPGVESRMGRKAGVLLDGLALLKTTQKWVGVKMTVMPENAHSLHEDVVGLHELGVNQPIHYRLRHRHSVA